MQTSLNSAAHKYAADSNTDFIAARVEGNNSNMDATMKNPVFLVGAERSGTTLLRLMLDHHPDIAFNSEFEYAVDCIEDGEWPSREKFYEFLETDRIFQSSGFFLDLSLDFKEQLESFLKQKQKNKSIVGATVHRRFDELLKIWPDARFIHIVRDPRDVARSCIGMNWAGNVWTGVERWLEAEELWEELKPRLDPANYTEIKFESLLQEPNSNLQRLCELMGTSYDPEMMSYPANSSYSLPEGNLAVQWRRKLNSEQIKLVEARAGDLMHKRGYQLSELAAGEVGLLRSIGLEVHSYFAVVFKRINVYGLPLVIQSFISNKMGLRKWHKKVRLKFNEIDSVMLK